MIKKLLNKFTYFFSYEYDREKIEKYLAKSSNLYDLENRQRKLDSNKSLNRFYI